MAEDMYCEWLYLVAYCEDRNAFDPAVFKSLHDDYAKAWSRLSHEMQGEVSALIDGDRL